MKFGRYVTVDDGGDLCHVSVDPSIGSLSKSLRLALIRLPEVNFPKNKPLRMYVGGIQPYEIHSRPQRPRSFWSAPRIATSGHVQHRKSTIHGLPVTLRMLRVKSDKSDWFWSQSIVFTDPFKTGMSLDWARGRDSWC